VQRDLTKTDAKDSLEAARHEIATTDAYPHWQKIGIGHHHGIALPLRSLITRESSGIGEFLDLLPIIDWCSEIGFDVIQLLPLNDSGLNPSPYSALSAFALNPVHLRLTESWDELKALNKTPRIDYQNVVALKRPRIKAYLEEKRSEMRADKAYQSFVHENPWLEGYARFRLLSEKHDFVPWQAWDTSLDLPQDQLELFKMAQYLCHQQLSQVKEYADQKGVLLMGDVPILLNPNSADVWLHQESFDLEQTVGAPPDQFSEEGQNWGFPLYRWEKMAPHYNWWQMRLKAAESYYHLYRIDHVVGFFRFWTIPPGKSGREGAFHPADLDEALVQGKHLMQMMRKATPMLPMGEDLGVIPKEVRHTLRHLGIAGTKVMRWERDWHRKAKYLDPTTYQPISMTTVSTHDTEPLRGWWEAHKREARALTKQMGWMWHPHLDPEHHLDLLSQSHRSGSLFHVNPLQEYLSLVEEFRTPPEEERINRPGTTSSKNWTYRLPASVEEIISHPGLAEMMKELKSNTSS